MSARRFVESLLAMGRYTFTREEAQAALGGYHRSVYMTLRKLQRQGWIASPRPRAGFYVIVEPAYQAAGSPPPEWYIDSMMRHAGVGYYVALLSAARLHGASHQAVMEFQVMVDQQFRPIEVGRVRFRFCYKKRLADTAVERRNTHTGYMVVATPETTAVDLVRYRESAGSVGSVWTVLAELAPRLDPAKLVAAGRALDEVATLQRLGLMLDRLGASAPADALAAALPRSPAPVMLDPETPEEGHLDRRWMVRINVEMDLDTEYAEEEGRTG